MEGCGEGKAGPPAEGNHGIGGKAGGELKGKFAILILDQLKPSAKMFRGSI